MSTRPVDASRLRVVSSRQPTNHTENNAMPHYKPGKSYWNGLIRRFLATSKERFVEPMTASFPVKSDGR